MRILFFTENYPPETNAAATRVHERAVYWARWGHEVTVVTCAPNFPYGRLFDGYQNKWRQEETLDGIRVVRVKTYIAPNQGVVRRTLDFLSYMVTAFLAARRLERPDVVVSTSPQFFAAVSAWAFSRRHNLRYVFELGDLWPASIAAVGAMRPNLALRLLEKLELRMYRDADAVVALTPSFKRNLVRRHIPSDKIAVVINGVDLWRYAPKPRDPTLSNDLGIGAADCVFGYIGTHGMAHALGNVLDAAKLLTERKDIKVLFAGPGAERDALKARAKAEALTNVRFLDPQPKERMPDVWSLCDVALVHLKDTPAFAEVIPSKIFEAMGMGLPILYAGPAGDGSAIVDTASAGVCVDPEQPAALAKVMTALADDPAHRSSLAANSLAAAPGHSREAQAQHMINVLDAVVAGDGDGAANVAKGDPVCASA